MRGEYGDYPSSSYNDSSCCALKQMFNNLRLGNSLYIIDDYFRLRNMSYFLTLRTFYFIYRATLQDRQDTLLSLGGSPLLLFDSERK